MPLRASQLLVRTASLESLSEALARALRRLPAPRDGSVRKLIAAQAGGWASLVEPGGADGGLARLLSETAGEVLAIELDGAALVFRRRRYLLGEPGEAVEDAYHDVELLAWRELRELGVPTSLRLCSFDSLEVIDEDVEAGLPALVAELGPAGASVRPARALPPEAREGDEPPADPDLLVESAAGEASALEVRRLSAAPTAELARRIAEVEEGQALRMAAQLARSHDGERIPRPSFAYLGPHADDLAPLIRRARGERPVLARLLDPEVDPPLTHSGFTALCRRAIEEAMPEARVVRAHALRLELLAASAPGSMVRAPLAVAYDAYLRSEREEPAAAAALVVEAVRALCAEQPRPLSGRDRDELLAGLLPTLVPAEARTGRACAPFAGPLFAGLLLDDGRRIAPVDASALEALGVRWQEALQRAVENAERLTLDSPRAITYFDLDEGRVAVCDFDDPGGVGRLLSPLCRALLLELLGGSCVAAVPTRDALLACSPGEEEAVRWLREEARRRYAEGPFPLHPGLFEVAEEGAVPVAEDPLGG